MVIPAPSTSEETAHGGRLIAARQAFPMAPEPWIDLSTGISPYAYPVEALPDAVFRRLPEPEQENALRAVAAEAYGAPDADHVCLAPGSQMLISLLPLLLPCRRSLVLDPGYAGHEAAWRRSGASVHRAGTAEALSDMAAENTVLALCNPNNPDGRRLDPAALRALVERCERLGAWLVIDEAYADLEPDVPRAAELLARFERLVILRSFGKSYGLAGMRFGVLLGRPGIVRAMADLMGPWPVSGPALAIATRALADQDWRRNAAGRAAHASSRLDRLLHEAGWTAVGGTALFRLAASPDAADRWRGLAAQGLLARRFEDRADRLRFGLPPDEPAWRRLSDALARR
ncbi:threonine-phosphate decarboxylase CobD [Acetobacteraceae bacterium KSS8]|uniref:threonine-phosphate decarboxylase n=1 Tax=Endosaccharibacter trunci TaxID=2812733 RepID=A0ABT1W795_9PROT|nr:threonine-phosphate decarboxylase CobD [Acetobacteraceae bacterium KSS8]